MLKKLFVTAAAAAAVSVPLAGAAWAEPPDDPGSNGNGIGQGGIPAKTGTFLNAPDNFEGVTIPGGTTINGQPIPPGQIFREAAKVAGQNVPDAYGDQLTEFYNSYGLPGDGVEPGPLPPGVTVEIGRTIPGSGVRLFTPGCGKGGPRPSVTVTAGGDSQTAPAPCVD